MNELVEALAHIFGRALFNKWGCAVFLLLAGGLALYIWLEDVERAARG